MKIFLFLSTLAALFLATHAKSYETGLIQTLDWDRDVEWLSFKMSVDLPKHFDWREKLGKEPEVLDQGNCGSCWAFSRVMTISWQHLIKGEVVTPAPQELVSCDRQQYGCGGGFWDNYELSGISDEADFGYKASNVRCKKNLPRMHKIAKWLYIGSHGRNPLDSEIKQAIYEYGPVGVTITVTGNFPNGCKHGQTNHMVVVVGWDDDKKVWFMQNSWGKTWKDKGYADIRYGCYDIGETAAVAILPK